MSPAAHTPRRRTTASLCLVALCAGALQPLTAQRPLPAGPAWSFTWTVTPTADGKAIGGGAFILDVAIWNGTVRITPREGPLRALAGEGGSILLRTADSSLAVVKPSRREALTAGAGDLATLMSGPAGTLPIAVSDVSSRQRDRGAGSPVFGYATRRVEVTEAYTLEVSTPTARRVLRTTQRHERDVSRELSRLDPGFRTFSEQFAEALGVPAAVRAQLRAVQAAAPVGIPVLVTTTGTTIAGTDTLRTLTRSAMTGLQRITVDTASFSIPAGYRITEMRRLLQQRRPSPP